jgi:hypothetical protein
MLYNRYRGLFPGDKLTTHPQLVLRSRKPGPIHHSPLRPHGVGTTLSFYIYLTVALIIYAVRDNWLLRILLCSACEVTVQNTPADSVFCSTDINMRKAMDSTYIKLRSQWAAEAEIKLTAWWRVFHEKSALSRWIHFPQLWNPKEHQKCSLIPATSPQHDTIFSQNTPLHSLYYKLYLSFPQIVPYFEHLQQKSRYILNDLDLSL